jgi:Ala-tRNA(Pro) deacylase
MISQKVALFLEQNKVKYNVIKHPIAYTAQGIAHAAHISGKEIAKTVLIKVDGTLKMIVLPANRRVNMHTMQKHLGSRNIRIAREDEFKDLFNDCEIGGMPPLGNLYGLDVFVSDDLTHDEEIAFNAGDHTELVKLLFNDYIKLVHPSIIHI